MEQFPDLAELQKARADEFIRERKAEKRSEVQNMKKEKLLREEQAKLRSYSSIMRVDKVLCLLAR